MLLPRDNDTARHMHYVYTFNIYFTVDNPTTMSTKHIRRRRLASSRNQCLSECGRQPSLALMTAAGQRYSRRQHPLALRRRFLTCECASKHLKLRPLSDKAYLALDRSHQPT